MFLAALMILQEAIIPQVVCSLCCLHGIWHVRRRISLCTADTTVPLSAVYVEHPGDVKALSGKAGQGVAVVAANDSSTNSIRYLLNTLRHQVTLTAVFTVKLFV